MGPATTFCPNMDCVARGQVTLSILTYVGGAQILAGTPIMAVQPKSYDDSGLTFKTYYCVKPQFFEAGTFSTAVTMTVTAVP